MLKIWDSGSQVFREPEFVRKYDPGSGVWVDCQRGQAFKDGAWETVWPTKPQTLMLYDAGTEYVNFTTFYSTYMGNSGGVAKETDKIRLTGGTNTRAGVCTSEPIDLTPYRKACANVQIVSAVNDSYDAINIRVHTKRASGSTTALEDVFGDEFASEETREKGKIITLEADITKVTANAHVTVVHYYVSVGYVYQIWLE